MFKCLQPECDATFKQKNNMYRHVRNIHGTKLKFYTCTYENCKKKFKTKSNYKRHLRNVHDEGEIIWHECEICNYKAKTNCDLKGHMANIHDVEVTWYKCPQKECTYKCKHKSSIKRHLTNVHNIGVIWYNCPQKECTYKCKHKSSIKSHLTNVHNIGVIWYNCPQKRCKYKSKYKITRHLASVHDIGGKWYKCPQKDCTYKSKQKTKLTRHLANVHDVGVIMYPCKEEGCNFETKDKSYLKIHSAYKHNKDVNWYKCPYKNCKDTFKQNGNLRRHLMYIHDVGNYKCELCFYNRNSKIEYIDKNNNKIHICKDCFKKVTGKNSRAEEQMSDYLDNMKEIKPFLVGTDQSFISIGGCQRYRPDKLYVSLDLVLHIECDEYQHKRDNGSYKCDEKRISDCYNEFPGKKYMVIRWNPDNYKPPYKYQMYKRKDRLKILGKLIKKVLKDPPKEIIYIYYLFFDKNNPRLPKNIKYKLIYN